MGFYVCAWNVFKMKWKSWNTLISLTCCILSSLCVVLAWFLALGETIRAKYIKEEKIGNKPSTRSSSNARKSPKVNLNSKIFWNATLKINLEQSSITFESSHKILMSQFQPFVGQTPLFRADTHSARKTGLFISLLIDWLVVRAMATRSTGIQFALVCPTEFDFCWNPLHSRMHVGPELWCLACKWLELWHQCFVWGFKYDWALLQIYF